jgi:hypothetical protein
MPYTVTKAQERMLLELPENGMGYQLVRAIPERSNEPIH